MSDHSAIEVTVPARWRLAGGLFVLFAIVCFGLYLWLLFFAPTPPDTEMKVIAALHLIATLIFICYVLPVFIGRYPVWFVRLVGRNHLIKIIANCQRQLGANREEKAHILLPHAWMRDQRIFWIVLLIGCGVLGVFHANGWL